MANTNSIFGSEIQPIPSTINTGVVANSIVANPFVQNYDIYYKQKALQQQKKTNELSEQRLLNDTRSLELKNKILQSSLLEKEEARRNAMLEPLKNMANSLSEEELSTQLNPFYSKVNEDVRSQIDDLVNGDYNQTQYKLKENDFKRNLISNADYKNLIQVTKAYKTLLNTEGLDPFLKSEMLQEFHSSNRKYDPSEFDVNKFKIDTKGVESTLASIAKPYDAKKTSAPKTKNGVSYVEESLVGESYNTIYNGILKDMKENVFLVKEYDKMARKYNLQAKSLGGNYKDYNKTAEQLMSEDAARIAKAKMVSLYDKDKLDEKGQRVTAIKSVKALPKTKTAKEKEWKPTEKDKQYDDVVQTLDKYIGDKKIGRRSAEIFAEDQSHLDWSTIEVKDGFLTYVIPPYSTDNGRYETDEVIRKIPLIKTDKKSIQNVSDSVPSSFKSAINKHESKGDSNALYNFQNNAGGEFSDINLNKMSLQEVIDFTSKRGKGSYAEYVKNNNPLNWTSGKVGEGSLKKKAVVSTPVGKYQFTGTTLKNLVNKHNIDTTAVFDEKLQDKLVMLFAQDNLKNLKTPEEKRKFLTNTWEGFKKAIDSGKMTDKDLDRIANDIEKGNTDYEFESKQSKKEPQEVKDLKEIGAKNFKIRKSDTSDEFILISETKDGVVETPVPITEIDKYKDIEGYGDVKKEKPLTIKYSKIVNSNRKGVRPNKDGTVSTHLMMWGEADGKYVVYPSLFQNKDGSWEEFPKDDKNTAFKEAVKRGEVYVFDNKQEAIDFAAGSWKKVEDKSSKYAGDILFQ